MIEGHVLTVGLLDAFVSDIDLSLVKTLVNLRIEAELFADGLQGGSPSTRPLHLCIIVLTVRVLACPGLPGLLVSRLADSNFSEPMSLLIDSVLRSVDLVDGLGCRVVNFGGERGLADAHPILVDQFDQQTSLLVGHR